MSKPDCTACHGDGVVTGGERGEIMEPCPVCNPSYQRSDSGRTNLKALLAARTHSSILDVYPHPQLSDKLVMSEQLKRIEVLLTEILTELRK